MAPLGEHVSALVDENDDVDCCWSESEGTGAEQWWRIDVVRGIAVTYCYAVHNGQFFEDFPRSRRSRRRP